MSNYSRLTKNPKTGKFEMADWLDDYYGEHIYGVRFNDCEVYHVDRHKWEFKDEA